MLQIFTALALMGVIFAVLLRRRETYPKAHGLETITARNLGAPEPHRATQLLAQRVSAGVKRNSSKAAPEGRHQRIQKPPN